MEIIIDRVIETPPINRITDHGYYMDIQYEHLWKELATPGHIENIIGITMSHQFYNPDNGQEFLTTYHVYYKIVDNKRMFFDTKSPKTRHPNFVNCIANLLQQAYKITTDDLLKKDQYKQFGYIPIKNPDIPQWERQVTLMLGLDLN